MRAVVTRAGQLEVTEIDEPEPGPGHVLVRSLACGICGSDLHALQDFGRFAQLAADVGGPGAGLDPDAGVVFGHEYCAEIVDYGPGTERTLPVGTAVCSVPVILGPQGPESIGYSNHFPGALAEMMVLQEALLLPVPDGLTPEMAALTEPLSVGEHAVAKAAITADEVCLVIGCGPVGLAVIAALKARGHGPVIAADFAPGRRALAERLGADQVIDPAAESPYGKWADFGIPSGLMELAGLEMLGAPIRQAVIFEAVGVPGVLQAIIAGAPPRARVVVVGVCMQTDQIEPFSAIVKELDVRFAFAYGQHEFAATLTRLGRGELAVDSLVTDVVGIDGVRDAFEALRTPGEHGKVLIRQT